MYQKGTYVGTYVTIELVELLGEMQKAEAKGYNYSYTGGQ